MKILGTNRQLMTLVFLMTMLLVSSAGARVWFVPSLEEGQELWVVNHSGAVQDAWLSPAQQDLNTDNEITLTVAPRSRARLQPPSEWGEPRWLQIKGADGGAQTLQVLFKNNGRWILVPEGRSARRELASSRGEAVRVTNLSPIGQEGRILVQFRNGGFWQKRFRTEGFESTKISLPDPEFSRIQIHGEMPLLATTLNSSDDFEFFRVGAEDRHPKSQTARFVLSNPDKTQSFVVEIKDPELIRQAREQIQFPNELRPRVLIGKISATPNQTNQNLASPLRGSWSWHVSDVIRFAGFGAQWCDGYPEYIEEYLAGFLKSETQICFWSYQVTEELK